MLATLAALHAAEEKASAVLHAGEDLAKKVGGEALHAVGDVGGKALHLADDAAHAVGAEVMKDLGKVGDVVGGIGTGVFNKAKGLVGVAGGEELKHATDEDLAAAKAQAGLQHATDIRDDDSISTKATDLGVAEAKDEELPNLLQETLEAIEQAKEAAGKADQEILFGGLEQKLAQLAAAAESAIQNNGQQSAEEDAAQEQRQQSNEKAEIAEDELKVALRQEIGQGLVAVDRQEDKVIITVGAGGAFPSGSADLTDAARAIMEEIAGVSESGSGEITVSGHTDDVPLIFGSQYRDNWDLAAARASSVVQALEGTGKVPAGRLQAISYGESQPVESNETARGRATNRRIEIEINY